MSSLCVTSEIFRYLGPSERTTKKKVTHNELVELLEQFVVDGDCFFDGLDDDIVCG